MLDTRSSLGQGTFHIPGSVLGVEVSENSYFVLWISEQGPQSFEPGQCSFSSDGVCHLTPVATRDRGFRPQKLWITRFEWTTECEWKLTCIIPYGQFNVK